MKVNLELPQDTMLELLKISDELNKTPEEFIGIMCDRYMAKNGKKRRNTVNVNEVLTRIRSI